MGYRASRKHHIVGWPEALLVTLIVLTIAPATVWWTQHYQPVWQQAGGVITSAETVRIHYNAQDYRIKAAVNYEYMVGLVKYAGSFVGYWPEMGNPNAMPPDEFQLQAKPGKPLVVFYDPANPGRSQLYLENTGPGLRWIVLAAAGLGCTVFYTFVVYPRRRA